MKRRQFVLGAGLTSAAYLPLARVWGAEIARTGSDLPARNLSGGEITLARSDIADFARSRGDHQLAERIVHSLGISWNRLRF